MFASPAGETIVCAVAGLLCNQPENVTPARIQMKPWVFMSFSFLKANRLRLAGADMSLRRLPSRRTAITWLWSWCLHDEPNELKRSTRDK